RTRVTAVFFSRSQWILPTVLGFNSLARDATTERSHSCRFSRFCHTQSLSDAKRSANSLRSDAGGSPDFDGDWAWEGATPPATTKTSRVTEPERHAGPFPNMYSTIPSLADDCLGLSRSNQ